jgi:hypothetical protein
MFMPNDSKSFAAPRALSLGFSPADTEGKRVVYCKPCRELLTPCVSQRRNGTWKVAGIYCPTCFGTLSLKLLAGVKHEPDAQEVETP